MFGKPTVIFASIVLLAAGCGHWPPIVNTKGDVQRLPVSELSVRARGLPDSDIPSLARLHDLRDLDFWGGWAVEKAKITDEGLAQLANLDLPYLEILSLGSCDKITDAGLEHIARIQTITALHLPDCVQITDAGVAKLTNAKKLTYLDLRGCPSVTDVGIQKLADKTDWEQILLGGCPKVTADGVARLQASLPNAKIKKDDEEWKLRSRKK